jgi:transmembrane sensor
MHELEQLIRKFWANQTTLAENRRLIELMESYNDAVKDKVQKDFQTDGNHSFQTSLPSEKASFILRNIYRELKLEDLAQQQQTRDKVVRQLYRRLAVAACLCLVAGSVLLFTGRRRESRQIAKTVTSDSSRLIRLVNGPDSAMLVVLKDGSTVQLGKNSSISYYEPFIHQRRDISMNGIAVFKVTKDKSRPFTVYAGGIATKVLGTRFLVNAADAGKVRVRLLEGKVVLNTVAGSGMVMNDVYLIPGQEFSFDKSSRLYTVNTMPDKPGRTIKPVLTDNKAELIFRKEPLDLVFKKVGDLYNVPLTFNRENMKGLYFTGTFLKSDDLNVVLSSICNVNDLHFEKQQDSIIITRSH